MRNRALQFASLLAVIGVSIVFGMLVGGRLNAPQVTFAAPAATAAQPSPAASGIADPRIGFADIVEAAMPAVVRIHSTKLPSERQADDGRPTPEDWFWRRFFGDPEQNDPRRSPQREEPNVGEGSGFIISDDGYILTNNHVVDGADDVRVGLQDGREFTAQVIGTDPSIDLALVKIETNGESLPVLPLGNSQMLRVGEWVIAIGNPLEFEQTVTVGVLSAKERRIPIGNTDSGVVSFLQTDAAINFGNSGGPLIDAQGHVVGINTAIRRANFAEGIGFALPIDQARNVIEQLRERGFVKRGYIGITMNQEGIDDAAREWLGLPDTRGVIVDVVTENGPAEKAGVRAGDVIRRVDGDIVKDNLDLISKIASRQPGDDVRLEIFRKHGDKTSTLDLTAKLQDRDEGLRANATPQAPGIEPRGEEPSPAKSEGFGMTVTNLTRSARERLGLPAGQNGVVVTDIEFNSAAARKGVEPDMLVTSINGRAIDSVDDWNAAIKRNKPGQPVKIDLRDGQRAFSIFLHVPNP